MKTDYFQKKSHNNVYQPGCMRYYVVYRLRRFLTFAPELDLVMKHSGELMGYVLYMRSSNTSDDR